MILHCLQVFHSVIVLLIRKYNMPIFVSPVSWIILKGILVILVDLVILGQETQCKMVCQ